MWLTSSPLQALQMQVLTSFRQSFGQFSPGFHLKSLRTLFFIHDANFCDFSHLRSKQTCWVLTHHTRRGRSRGGACCLRHQFWGAKCAKFHRETPPFLCFRTKSDVHPVRTESLSENHVHSFEIFGKTYLTLFAQYWSSRKMHPKKRSCVIVLDYTETGLNQTVKSVKYPKTLLRHSHTINLQYFGVVNLHSIHW